MRRIEGEPDGSGLRIAIVMSRFNEVVTEQLAAGALECLGERGVAPGDVDVIAVPGAWELPAAAARAADSERYDAIVALGCVIRGETPHFEFVAGEAARGLGRISGRGRIPVGFGVLTTEDMEQALARAGGPGGNKGREAALAALEMAGLFRALGTAEDGPS